MGRTGGVSPVVMVMMMTTMTMTTREGQHGFRPTSLGVSENDDGCLLFGWLVWGGGGDVMSDGGYKELRSKKKKEES